MAEPTTPKTPKTPKHEVPKKWVEHKGRASMKPSVEETGVEEGVYLTWIKKELDNESACLELPFTMVLMISFSMLAIMHLKQDKVLMIENSIEQDIIENANFAFSHFFGHKNIFDVHSFPDFWSWLRLGFIPLVVQPTWSYSEGYMRDVVGLNFEHDDVEPNSKWNFSAFPDTSKELPIRGDYLHYNRIIGGIRFRQQRVQGDPRECRFPSTQSNSKWDAWYGKPCMPAWMELAFEPDTMVAEEFSDESFVEYMMLDGGFDRMIGMAVDMEDGCEQLEAKGRPGQCLCEWCQAQEPNTPWLTEHTQRVEIGMITLNSEFGLITRTLVNFFFNRGSYIHKRVEVMSSWMDPWSVPWDELIYLIVFDTMWVSMLVYTATSELKEIVHVIRVGEGPRWYNSLWDDYVAFWNMVDWASIVIAIVVLSLFCELTLLTSSMHEAFRDLMGTSSAAIGQAEYKGVVISFFEAVEIASDKEKDFRMMLCIYPLIVMLRLFKSFHAQPRLAVVTATLMEAAQDMLHFFFVFFGCFFCLCLISVFLFGQDLEEFATLWRALHSCFRMMFGDWDWHPMQQIRRQVAMVWFSMFMGMMVVILLNMLLAIIMDNYMLVKKKSGESKELWVQMKEINRRRAQSKRKERVRLNDIYATFAKMEGDEKEMLRSTKIITPKYLIDNVPGIPLSQATRTMSNARDEHEKSSRPDFDVSDMVKSGGAVERLDKATRKIRDALFYINDRVDYYDTMRAGNIGLSADADTALANAVAAVSAAAHNDSAVSSEVIEYITSEIGRLSAEAANKLAQTVKQVDSRQSYIERRQDDMVSSIREMHHTLLNLQSEASSLTNKLRRVCHEREHAPKSSTWRRGLRGKVVPACFMDCSPGDAQEALLPKMTR